MQNKNQRNKRRENDRMNALSFDVHLPNRKLDE